MAAAPALPLLLGLLAAQLCGSDAAGTAYSRLSEALKGGVDLALEKLHGHASIQHHFVFLRSVSQSDIQVRGRVCVCVSTAAVSNSPAQLGPQQI